jgi:hypothetical protein
MRRRSRPTIAAAFEQYRGKLVPESGAFAETAAGIAGRAEQGAGAIVAERNGDARLRHDRDAWRATSISAASPCCRERAGWAARRLIARGRGRGARRGLPGVRLGVRVVLTDNQKLFASLGYVETSREPHPGFDYPTSINMRKALE